MLRNSLYIICLLVGVLIGWMVHTAPKVPYIGTQQHVVTHTVVTEPDGTTEVTDMVDTSQVTTTVPPLIATPVPRPDWSVGVRHPLSPTFEASRLGVEVGRRLVWDMWGTAGWSSADGATLGVRVEW